MRGQRQTKIRRRLDHTNVARLDKESEAKRLQPLSTVQFRPRDSLRGTLSDNCCTHANILSQTQPPPSASPSPGDLGIWSSTPLTPTSVSSSSSSSESHDKFPADSPFPYPRLNSSDSPPRSMSDLNSSTILNIACWTRSSARKRHAAMVLSPPMGLQSLTVAMSSSTASRNAEESAESSQMGWSAATY
ncbi:hypothetical protein G4B88_015182 [Cannabis sativa]|uniref:Uncharacterized protein n=1 Tax=Cannabis sativa TaxID=3483 RepID=A0A7J6FYJ4_CANSA|nr:hypothetical protein G4B88_015182 [Cannabis sativa]